MSVITIKVKAKNVARNCLNFFKGANVIIVYVRPEVLSRHSKAKSMTVILFIYRAHIREKGRFVVMCAIIWLLILINFTLLMLMKTQSRYYNCIFCDEPLENSDKYYS